MKNYYKILGVKRTASDEEVRERWIELTKHYHPDLGEGNEKIKEINEAYQVLKFSSTRMEYDLEKNYERRKRRFYIQKISLPISIFVIFIIFGTLYIKKLQSPTPSKLIIRNQIDSPTQKSKDIIDPIHQVNPTKQIDSTTQKPYNTIDQRLNQSTTPKVENVIPKEITKVVVQESARLVSPPPVSPSSAERELKPEEKLSTPTVLKLEIPIGIDKTVSKEIKEIVAHKIEKGEETKQDAPVNFAPSPPQTEKIEQINQEIYQKGQMDQKHTIAHSPPLTSAPFSPIAKEEEVKQFLGNYIERYTKKDLEGFLSLFSSGAIQNRKDGPERMRTIYANFFNQSQEIRYYMEDIRIDVYQNPVEVKTHYEVVQRLKKGGEKIWRGEIQWALTKEAGALKIISIDFQHQKSP